MKRSELDRIERGIDRNASKDVKRDLILLGIFRLLVDFAGRSGLIEEDSEPKTENHE